MGLQGTVFLISHSFQRSVTFLLCVLWFRLISSLGPRPTDAATDSVVQVTRLTKKDYMKSHEHTKK